ncbi:MAG: indole-3-glycerol phosphate synthase TrpC [Desulfobacteraceae bacterium]|nr:indole-3-glycerol phosphate synthase TrpC [Desulfobacteraceae bacterium]
MAEDILEKIVSHKKEEIHKAMCNTPIQELKAAAGNWKDNRSLYRALKNPGQIHVIAEIKRASPSRGDIRGDLDPAALAGAYERGGASALSVLTDKTFFKGSLNDLASAKRAVSIPVLRKDFVISEYQVYESAAAGADAVLLIVRILPQRQLEQLLDLCRELSMEALVEVHTRADLEAALKTGADLIGINNRNLASFETDINIAAEMAKAIGPGKIAVAASGISSRKHIEQNLKAKISRFLIGESLVRSDDPETFLKHLING